MATIRWNPYTEIEVLRNQFDRMFHELADWPSPLPNTWQPPIELHDGGDKLVLKVQLPGWEAKDLDISVMREGVVIKGEYPEQKEHQNKGIYYSEFHYGKFQRAIKLPVAVSNNQVQAEFNNGILTLTLPKLEEVINRVVKINLGGPQQ